MRKRRRVGACDRRVYARAASGSNPAGQGNDPTLSRVDRWEVENGAGVRGGRSTPPEELAALVDREYPRLVGTLLLLTGDREAARDAAQEALIRLCRDWSKVRRMAVPAAWLTRVAINVARSQHRRGGAERRAYGRLGLASDEQLDPDAADRLTVRDALAALPDRQREVIVLRYYLDLDQAGIAAALGIGVGTVKSSLSRGLARLRTELDLEPEEVPDGA